MSFIVAIDGPAGVGKGTIAKRVADDLGLITIDTVLKPYSQSNKIELEYYQDLISKTYMLEEQCDIWVKPIFIEGYNHSHHNIIL